jgi:hypothetical protein
VIYAKPPLTVDQQADFLIQRDVADDRGRALVLIRRRTRHVIGNVSNGACEIDTSMQYVDSGDTSCRRQMAQSSLPSYLVSESRAEATRLDAANIMEPWHGR